MFSSKKALCKNTPLNGIDRRGFIEHLVEEFHTTTNSESQEQVTANLANFAYDPINFCFLREAGALDIFFELLLLPNEQLKLHAVAGICNICLDPPSRQIIRSPENLKTIHELFQSTTNPEIASNLLTLYHQLIYEEEDLRPQICTKKNVQRIQFFQNSSESRLKSLAAVILEDLTTLRIEIKA